MRPDAHRFLAPVVGPPIGTTATAASRRSSSGKPWSEDPDVSQEVPAQQARTIGLLAGWGRFPLTVAESLAIQGFEVIGVGIAGHADPVIARSCRKYREFGLTQLGGHIDYFYRHGVRHVVFAGKIQKTLLYERKFLWRNIPDLCCVRAYFSHFVSRRRDRTDDSLLTAAVRAYAKRGIGILPANTLIPELIMKFGQLGHASLPAKHRQDIAFGWRLAKEIGRLDIGQTVAIKGQSVLAVEAVEGTDECIRRAGRLCPQGQFVVVKVAKPQQDMRFDVPTIGIGTVQTMHQAGAAVLAVEADKTILIDRPEVTRLAQQYGIIIVAVRDGCLSDDMMALRLGGD
jgi:DUF1009 family protein